MIFRLCGAVLAVLLLSCAPTSAQVFQSAGNPGPQIYRGGHGFMAALGNVKANWNATWKGPPPRYVAPEYYKNLNERYPKFYGGFHSSYFHNMGLPPGDIGPRGNGIYPTPW